MYMYPFASVRSQKSSDDNGQLLERMISSAVGGDADDSQVAAMTSEQSSTSKLFALLVAGVARPDIVHADEAADTSEEEDGAEDAEGTDEAETEAASSASCRRTRPATFRIGDLDEKLRTRCRNPELLLADVRELLAAGADANARDADGNTLLYVALHVPHQKTATLIVHELLRHGADPNSRRHGATVCHHALRLGRASIVQRLLREGAYPQKSGTQVSLPPQQRLDNFAVRHGFGDEAIEHMQRALRAASARNDSRAAQSLLLHHGCPPDNLLLYALVRKRRALNIVSALLSSNADPNTADELGTHVLTLAVLQGDASMTQMLLAAGADPTVEEDGQTILELARRQGATELVKLMQAAVRRRAKSAPSARQ